MKGTVERSLSLEVLTHLQSLVAEDEQKPMADNLHGISPKRVKSVRLLSEFQKHEEGVVRVCRHRIALYLPSGVNKADARDRIVTHRLKPRKLKSAVGARRVECFSKSWIGGE